MWGEHYAKSFQTDTNTNHFTESHKCNRSVYRVNSENVAKCVKLLKNKKAAGPDGLVAENLKFADIKIYKIIANFYNSCLAHSFIPDVVLRVTLVPI